MASQLDAAEVEAVAVKTRRKWRTVEPFGQVLPGTRLLPAKTFVDGSPESRTGIVDTHTVPAALEAYPIVGIIDLSSHTVGLAYRLDTESVAHFQLPVKSRTIPVWLCALSRLSRVFTY